MNNIVITISNIRYQIHTVLIIVCKQIRYAFGKFNSRFINIHEAHSCIKIHPWQLKLLKCVTPDDFYVATGIYDALIKSKRCNSYRNFGFNSQTNNAICKILCSNWRWHEETRFGHSHDRIKLTWVNSAPMNLDEFDGIPHIDDWWLLWSEGDIINVWNV